VSFGKHSLAALLSRD